MKRKTKVKTQITLVLNEEEAKYLKGLVQNPLCDPAQENPNIKRIRFSFWNALKDIKVI